MAGAAAVHQRGWGGQDQPARERLAPGREGPYSAVQRFRSAVIRIRPPRRRAKLNQLSEVARRLRETGEAVEGLRKAGKWSTQAMSKGGATTKGAKAVPEMAKL